MEALYLSGNQLNDDGALILSKCIDKIDNLSLEDCKISEIGVVALAEQIQKREKPVSQIKIFHYILSLLHRNM